MKTDALENWQSNVDHKIQVSKWITIFFLQLSHAEIEKNIFNVQLKNIFMNVI